MNKCFVVIVVILTFFSFGSAQNVGQKPSQTPTPADNDVVKISTNLIQLDVTVTDRKGKPIPDLRLDEIEVFENGQKQKITNLNYISSRSVAEKPVQPDKIGVPQPPVILRPEQIKRTIAIVVDDLSLSFESVYQTRRALKKFVDEQIQVGDLAAIIRTGGGIGALQQFTADKRILYAAIERVRWNPVGSGGISAFAPIESAFDMSLQEEPPAEGAEETLATGAGQSLNDFRASVFATGTLGALRYIVTGMSELPGRKSVILFSDGFKLYEEDKIGFKESGRVMAFLRQLVDTANRSSVVFYSVDARGLVYTGFTAADSPAANSLSSVFSSRGAQLADTQDGLSYLAEETGGFIVKNSNDLAGGVRRVLEDQSYYLVAYEPDADTFDPAKRKYNQISVKVTRKDANVRYRSGFFNVPDKTVVNGSAATTPIGQLETALLSPFAVNGINLRLNALFGSDIKTGSYVRSLLHVDSGDLKFVDEPGGKKKAVFDVIAMSFGDNGQPVDQLGKTYTLSLPIDAYNKIVADGFVYHFMFPVKKPGAYQYRVAIRDALGGKVGSASQFIEVPDLKKNRLNLSSIVIEKVAAEAWNDSENKLSRDPMSDTALRRIKTGSYLRYGFEIYNAKLGPNKLPQLQTKIRIIHDGQLVLDGKQLPFDLRGQTDMKQLKTVGAISLGTSLVPGDYILQVIVIDPLAKTKQQIATQYVQFEIVE